jgi:transposase-like protein
MRHEFKGRHFEGEIILWAVRWYCKYGISYRELEEMMEERGIEADHGKLKRLIKPTFGFKSMKTAYATIRGFEVMHAMRKGQAKLWMLSSGVQGEVRLVERAFGLGPSIMTEMMRHLETTLA